MESPGTLPGLLLSVATAHASAGRPTAWKPALSATFSQATLSKMHLVWMHPPHNFEGMAEPPEQLRMAVVDDHPVMRDGVALLVERWRPGTVVLQAADGVDYEQRVAAAGHIHLAVVDLQMPRRDGYETIRWILHHHPRTKVIAFGDSTSAPEVRQALRAGARAVLNKRIAPAEFQRALEHVHTTGFYYNELVGRDLLRSVRSEHTSGYTPDARWQALTTREREFVRLYTSPQVATLAHVAERMGVKPGTAETFRKHCAAKLEARTKAEMVRLVMANGWK